MKHVILLIGPTAIGKTKMSISLATKLHCEIISADSKQIYKNMNIGTAKPTRLEQNGIKHYLIDYIDPNQIYTVYDYLQDAIKAINNTLQYYNITIITGGSGLYVNAIYNYYNMDENSLSDIPSISDDIRNQVRKLYTEKGLEECVKKLLELDANSDKHIELKNPQRVQRALEVILQTQKPIYSFYNQTKHNNVNYDISFINIGLKMDMYQLYERIEKRVDMMFEQGLIEEVKSLYKYKDCNALNTIGYKEVFDYLDGKISLQDTKNIIKQNTRNFARRQMTWFKNQLPITWFDYDTEDEIYEFIKEHLE